MKFLPLKDQLFRTRRETEATKARQNDIDIVNSIAFVTLVQSGSIDEVTATEHIDLFAIWQPNINYAAGTYVNYENTLYKCIQAHTSQEDWIPADSASLWIKAGDPTVEFPEWSQPVGAHDAYMNGDKVSHNDKQWVSIVDNNVWEPGVYGWEVVQQS